MTISYYLTQLKLRKENYAVMHDLKNRYRLHNVISQAYIGMTRQLNRVLWCVDTNYLNEARVLIQSQIGPNWNHLKKGYLWQPPEVAYKTLTLSAGEYYLFRLFGNPVSRQNRDDASVLPLEERVVWLHNKLEAAGFSLENGAEIESKTIIMDKGPDLQITLYETRFEGMLKVVDSETAEKSIIEGIGRGKAFGMGLLSLVKHQEY